MFVRLLSTTLLVLFVIGCVTRPFDVPLGPYTNLVDSRGELPPFSARLPRDMTVKRSFASARAERPGLVIDVRSVLLAPPVSCAGLSACLQDSITIDRRRADAIRYRAGGTYPLRLKVVVPFRDKAIVAEALCVSHQQCGIAEQILEGAVFGQIATSGS